MDFTKLPDLAAQRNALPLQSNKGNTDRWSNF